MTTATETPDVMDALDAAMNAKALPGNRTFFAEVTTIDTFFCVLIKGQGKVLFDSGVHSEDQKRVAIKLIAVPVKGEFELKQDTLATANDWLKFTLPSLRKIGQTLKTLKGQFVRVQKVPTGDTYKKGDETIDRTALVFEDVFADRAACVAAADAYWAERKSSNGQADAAPETAQASASTEPENDGERQFALDSLPMLWKAAKEKYEPFIAMIEGNPMIAKYVRRDSPEVVVLTGVPF